MTQQKKLKRIIRARARKTGESYAAARRHVVTSGRQAEPLPTKAPTTGAARMPEARPTAERQARKGEKGVVKKTGHGYDHWFAILDAFGAPARGHTASAAHLYNDHGVPGWHCQMIAVEYERARGLRAMNQSCAGDFQVNITKAVDVPASEAIDAISSARRRAAWLKHADPSLVRGLEAALRGPDARRFKVRKSAAGVLRYPWNGATVEIAVIATPNGRTTVVASCTKLAGPEEVGERRAQWRQALEGLKSYLTS